MAKTKTLMERIESIGNMESALAAQIDDGLTSNNDLKDMVAYQYECMTGGGSFRWEYATQSDKAKLRRLYKDVVSGKFN